jgi:endonuclease/exonuclease/phosphatase family metal-dependent hydrolase
VVWNVFGPQDRKPWEVVTGILQALDADVLLLNEVPQLLKVPAPADVAAWLPVSRRSGAPAWQVSRSGEVAIAVRGGLEDVFGRPPRRRVRTLYDMLRALTFSRPRVAAAGGMATIGSRRILAVPLHFACCGAVLERAEESRALHVALTRVLPLVRPNAVLVGGDFNTVGDLEPVETLLRGTDVDGSQLAIVAAPQLDGLSSATWRPLRARDARFAPARLDWLLYSRSSLELLNAFVFDASDLSPHWLQHHGLSADASARTSDHLPVVADFKWRR